MITIGSYWIPILLTVGCLWMMFRPWRPEGDFDIGVIFRVMWLLPMSLIWMTYFGILLLLR